MDLSASTTRCGSSGRRCRSVADTRSGSSPPTAYCRPSRSATSFRTETLPRRNPGSAGRTRSALPPSPALPVPVKHPTKVANFTHCPGPACCGLVAVRQTHGGGFDESSARGCGGRSRFPCRRFDRRGRVPPSLRRDKLQLDGPVLAQSAEDRVRRAACAHGCAAASESDQRAAECQRRPSHRTGWREPNRSSWREHATLNNLVHSRTGAALAALFFCLRHPATLKISN